MRVLLDLSASCRAWYRMARDLVTHVYRAQVQIDLIIAKHRVQDLVSMIPGHLPPRTTNTCSCSCNVETASSALLQWVSDSRWKNKAKWSETFLPRYMGFLLIYTYIQYPTTPHLPEMVIGCVCLCNQTMFPFFLFRFMKFIYLSLSFFYFYLFISS